MTRKTLTAKTPADLIDKVFQKEGWVKLEGQNRVRMVKTLYTLTVDHRNDKFVATPM